MRRKQETLKTLQPERKRLAGSFQFNGGSDPINLRGDGVSVTRESAGRFRVFFADPYYGGFFIGGATLQLAAATDMIAQLQQRTDHTDGRVTILVHSLNAAGAATDVAADANNRLHWWCTLRNGSR